MSITAPVQRIVPAVRALAAAVTAAFETADDPMRVITGAAEVVEDSDFVMISAPTADGAGVLLKVDPSDQGHSQKWQLTIVVLLSTWSAERDILARLERIQEMVDVFADAVAQNPNLDGTVSVADIGDQGQLATFDNQDGVAAEIALTVTCEVY